MAKQHFGPSDKRKQSLYFPKDMLESMQREAERQDRSLSWIAQRAWMIAEEEIRTFDGHMNHRDHRDRADAITGETATPSDKAADQAEPAAAPDAIVPGRWLP